MKHFFIFSACFFLLPAFSFCQTVSGTVKDENNKPVGYASIGIKGTKKGTNADSLGFFRLDVKAKSELLVTKTGYKDALVKLNTDSVIIIILKADEIFLESAQVSSGNTKDIIKRNEIVSQQIISNTFSDFVRANSGTLYTGSFLPVFTQKEDTKGSRYLFDKWVAGAVLDSAGVIVNSDAYLFNYDKIISRLLFKKDPATVIEVDYQVIRAFELANGATKYYFEKVPFINKKIFMQKLNLIDGKYTIYKKIKTHFEKSNYKSDGLIESGNKYDEFVDEFEYFIVLNDFKQFEEVQLKKKSILGTFNENGFNESSKSVNDYFLLHKDDFINETFLTGLIDYLNTIK